MNARRLLRAYCARRELGTKTEKGYETVLNLFERWLGRPATIRDIARVANAYVRVRLDGGAIAGEPIRGNRHTARAHRAVLAILLRFASRRRLIRRRRLRPVRRRAHVPVAILPCELRRFLSAAAPDQRAAAMLALDTGYRRSDLFALEWERNALERADGWIVWLVAEKTGRREVRRVRAETIEALRSIRRRDDLRMLPRQSKGFSRWRKRWHRTGRRAGVDTRRRGLQAIRRTGASTLRAAGKDPKRYLGHSTEGLADQWYIDPRIAGDIPDLPPPIDRPPPSPPPLG